MQVAWVLIGIGLVSVVWKYGVRQGSRRWAGEPDPRRPPRVAVVSVSTMNELQYRINFSSG